MLAKAPCTRQRHLNMNRSFSGKVVPCRINSTRTCPHLLGFTCWRARKTFTAQRSQCFRQPGGDPRQEEIAHRVAWAAVKRSYVKRGTIWVRRQGDNS